MTIPRHLQRKIFRLALSFQALFQALFQVLVRLVKWARNWLLKSEKGKKAGFVLPTTVMVLLVVGLFVGALIVRTGERSVEVIGSRESQRIDNIAAPAVERARAKLEHLFNSDPRFPAGVPSEVLVRDLMRYVNNDLVSPVEGESDPYKFPDETRIDLNGDEELDNAWTYETDLEGDGTSELVAYSILMQNQADSDGDGTNDITLSNADTDKASNLVTRTGPSRIELNRGSAAQCDIEGLEDENGWFSVSASSVRKNFQVNVFVENNNPGNRSAEALEFQQDRQLDRGNKYGGYCDR